MKIKIESEKLVKYRDLARQLEKKLSDIKITVRVIIVGAHGTFQKNLKKKPGEGKNPAKESQSLFDFSVP